MSPGKSPRVAIILPAYNEAGSIGAVITSIQLKLQQAKYSYEVVVVDDGSKDTTALEAQRAGAHVIKHILNTGSGGSTSTGRSYAQQNGFEIAVTMDADGQH